MTEPQAPQPDPEAELDAIYRRYFPADNTSTTTTEDAEYRAYFPNPSTDN